MVFEVIYIVAMADHVCRCYHIQPDAIGVKIGFAVAAMALLYSNKSSGAPSSGGSDGVDSVVDFGDGLIATISPNSGVAINGSLVSTLGNQGDVGQWLSIFDSVLFSDVYILNNIAFGVIIHVIKLLTEIKWSMQIFTDIFYSMSDSISSRFTFRDSDLNGASSQCPSNTNFSSIYQPNTMYRSILQQVLYGYDVVEGPKTVTMTDIVDVSSSRNCDSSLFYDEPSSGYVESLRHPSRS